MLYNHIKPEVEKTFRENRIVYNAMLHKRIKPEVEKIL